MKRTLVLSLSCATFASLLVGCSSEVADDNGAATNTPTAAASGDSKAGTSNQLSINPDYKK